MPATPRTDNPPPRTCAIILARAASKGLPGKNALPLAGKPVLAWTIQHAQQAARLDHIILSTDGDTLADIARAHGIDVILRPPHLANDTATIDSAARHALTTHEKGAHEKGVRMIFTHIVILYGNVPIRPPDLTDRALTKLIDTRCDSVQSVCPVGKLHPYWMRRLVGDSGDQLAPYQPNDIYRRQDLPPVYMLDGGIIALTRDSLFTTHHQHPHAFLGRDRRAIITNQGEVVDVDSQTDLRLAQAILQGRT